MHQVFNFVDNSVFYLVMEKDQCFDRMKDVFCLNYHYCVNVGYDPVVHL